ncbi:MAG: ATP-dependent helicase/deoxyribonuclease subunit B [Methanobacterium sp. PtaU1.Bin242]|nr:MAG: ATP-dependent helicase/deoxyribonuclease subunit B [Methanobacterium sp. PtaU1.Bin242]
MTPIYCLISSLFALLRSKDEENNYNAKEYFDFLFHPYIKNLKLSDNAEETRKLIQELYREFILTKKRKINLMEVEKIIIHNDLKEIHNKTLIPFKDISALKDITNKISSFIEYIKTNSTAYMHPYWNFFPDIIIEKLSEIANSELKNIRFKNTNDYFDLIENYISSSTYPFTGSPVSGLQAIGFLESRNLKFEKVFFLDCNDAVFPNIFKEDPILPHIVRGKIGLPDYKDRLNLYSFYFENLIYGAKKAFIFYIDTKGTGISPLANKLKWSIEKSGEKLKESFSFSSMNFSTKPLEPIEKTNEIKLFLQNFEFSHTIISEYLSCQIRFYYSNILKIKEINNIDDEMDKRQIGEIVHKILELYFKEKLKTGFSNYDLEKTNILRIAKEILSEYFPSYNKEGDEYLIYAQILRRIEDFISFHFSQDKDVEILDCETKENFLFPYSQNLKIKFTSRADRIDRIKGEIVICDYKTSSKPAMPNKNIEKIDFNEDIIKWGKTIGSLQLPIYSIAFSNRFNKKSYEINGSIILLGKKNIEKTMLFKDNDERKEKMDLYQKILSKILEDILNSPKFKPPEDDSQCQNCPYITICGKNV